jgi:hypothetical protein
VLGRSLGGIYLVLVTSPLRFLASDPSTTGEFRDKFPEHRHPVFRVAVCLIFGLPSSRFRYTHFPIAYVSCHLMIQLVRNAFESADVGMSDDAWATAFAYHLARYGGDFSVHTANSWLVTALAEVISEVRGALVVGDEVLTDPTAQLPNGNDGHPADVGVLHYYGIRGSRCRGFWFVRCF